MKVNHLLIPYLAALVFIFGSVLGSDGIQWYRTLTLPEFALSEGRIALIWAGIYSAVSWAALILWNLEHRDKRFRIIVGLFLCAAAANLVWSILFFHFHLILGSVVAALLLALALLGLIAVAWKRSRTAALLVVPFLLWVVFAAYFTYVLYTVNL